jgi:hypothetical protein
MANNFIPFIIAISILCLGNTTAMIDTIISVSYCVTPRAIDAPSPYLYVVYIFQSVVNRNPIRNVTKGVSGIYC